MAITTNAIPIDSKSSKCHQHAMNIYLNDENKQKSKQDNNDNDVDLNEKPLNFETCQNMKDTIHSTGIILSSILNLFVIT